MRHILVSLAVAGLVSACGQPQQSAAPPSAPTEAPVESTAPAGAYTLDKAHSSLIVRLNHLSYSQFTARFTTWDAQLQFDPATPANSQINVAIEPRSIASDNPPSGFIDIMRGSEFLDSAQFSSTTFRSTHVERTGPNTASITGDLTLHGVTKPITLEARFNGGYGGMQLDPHARIGFSAHGAFKRSDFGMSFGIPAPGTTMGVGDEVSVTIESEFSGPTWAAPATTP